MANTVFYPVHRGLYVNLTNRCSCACVFCIRSNAEGVYGSDSLWLEAEPSADEAVQLLDQYLADAPELPEELVFCGYGEPTERLDALLQVARHARERYGIPVRVNTNGQGSLINGRDIVPELAKAVDAVSVSLNAPNAARYQEISQSEFGEAAFDEVLRFAREAKAAGLDVAMTSVGTFLSAEEEQLCREICDQMGVRYRVRAYEG